MTRRVDHCCCLPVTSTAMKTIGTFPILTKSVSSLVSSATNLTWRNIISLCVILVTIIALLTWSLVADRTTLCLDVAILTRVQGTWHWHCLPSEIGAPWFADHQMDEHQQKQNTHCYQLNIWISTDIDNREQGLTKLGKVLTHSKLSVKLNSNLHTHRMPDKNEQA